MDGIPPNTPTTGPFDQQPRRAPRVVRVPAPEGLSLTPTVYSAIALAAFVIGCVVACAGLHLEMCLFWPGIVAVAVSVVMFCFGTRFKRRYADCRRQFVEEVQRNSTDPLAVAFAGRWHGGGKDLLDGEVQEILAGLPSDESGRAIVPCLGKIDVPEVGEVLFEPEIIAPTRYVGTQMWFVPIALALIGFWLFQRTGFIPGPHIPMGGFGYLVAVGVGAGAMWLWRTAIRPTYIRMAPGIIQIMQYRYRRAKPIIRSYPVEAGTVCIVRGQAIAGKKPHLTLTLLRGEQRDTIPLWRMRKHDPAIERTWQALLSTAPAPPLSDEDLIG